MHQYFKMCILEIKNGKNSNQKDFFFYSFFFSINIIVPTICTSTFAICFYVANAVILTCLDNVPQVSILQLHSTIPILYKVQLAGSPCNFPMSVRQRLTSLCTVHISGLIRAGTAEWFEERPLVNRAVVGQIMRTLQPVDVEDKVAWCMSIIMLYFVWFCLTLLLWKVFCIWYYKHFSLPLSLSLSLSLSLI